MRAESEWFREPACQHALGVRFPLGPRKIPRALSVGDFGCVEIFSVMLKYLNETFFALERTGSGGGVCGGEFGDVFCVAGDY